MPDTPKLIVVEVDGEKRLLLDTGTGLIKVGIDDDVGMDSICCCDCLDFQTEFSDCLSCGNTPHFDSLSLSLSGFADGTPPESIYGNCQSHACHLSNLNGAYGLEYCPHGAFEVEVGEEGDGTCVEATDPGILVWEASHCGGPGTSFCFHGGECHFCDCDTIDEETCECRCYTTQKLFVWKVVASIQCANIAPPSSNENLGRIILASVGFRFQSCSSSTQQGHCDCAGEGFLVCSGDAGSLPLFQIHFPGFCGSQNILRGAVFLPAECESSGSFEIEMNRWTCTEEGICVDPNGVVTAVGVLMGS